MILIKSEWVFCQFKVVVKKVSILARESGSLQVYPILDLLSQNKPFPSLESFISLDQSHLFDNSVRIFIVRRMY